MFDVCVIGAGVVGGLIARALSSYRLDICILEKENDVAMGASCANSGIVHAGYDAKPGTLKARLNVRGSEMMADVCRQLGVGYRNTDSLVVGFSKEDQSALSELLERGIANGVKGLRLIDRAELHKMEPNLSDRAECALYAPTAGIVCPYGLTIAAVGNAMDNGAECKLNFEVVSIRDRGDCFEIFGKGIETPVLARYLVNAAGMFSDAVAKMTGDNSFTVHPRRGEYVLLDKESGGLVTHTIFRVPSKMGKGILVTPTVDGNLLMGPTSEDISDKTDTSTTQPGLEKVIAEAQTYVNGIRPGQSITSFCGLRSVGSTGDFIIRVPSARFVNVAGIESPGLSSAPAIAEYVVSLLQKEGLTTEKNPMFDPYRQPMHAFRDAGIEEKNRMIEEDPAFGHIICRCETVTEGEILRALRQNPKPRDLDGIKRRTRAQMGRCQGGFCSPYLVELIAREQGIDFGEVTKCGGNSLINFGRTKEEN